MTHNSHLICTCLSYPLVVLFPCSFPYIVKPKFGDLATLNALTDQWRAQGGMFDLRLLMDRIPSKTKIWQWLMIQKVVDRIAELGEQHLKLVVMHDFLWALVEEQASNKAHQHQVKNKDAGGMSGRWRQKLVVYHRVSSPEWSTRGDQQCVTLLGLGPLWLTYCGRLSKECLESPYILTHWMTSM